MDIDPLARGARTPAGARLHRRSSRAIALCATAVTWVSFARAQPAVSPEDIASARALGIEGVRLAEAGDCASAIPKLQAAENLYHAPTTLERLGECEISVGHLVAGTETLNRVVREALPASAPPAFLNAQHRATQLLATAQPRIGKLRIHVEGAPADKVAVTVDGANVPSALFDAERATDPGTHEVKATAAGFRPVTSSVDVPPGADTAVWLKMEVDPTAGAPPPVEVPGAGGTTPATTTTANVTQPPTQPPPPSGPNRVPAVIALSLGGAGIAVGAVFGVLALGTKSTLDSACVSKVCPASSQDDINNLARGATLANIGFAVGAVGIAVGTVLLVTAHGSEPRTASAATSGRALRVEPWVGLGAAGVGGTFE